MRCTYSLCQSSNTKLIERTAKVHIEGDNIIDYDIGELWLCNNCGNPFHPGTKRVDLNLDGKRVTKERFIERLLGGLSFGFPQRLDKCPKCNCKLHHIGRKLYRCKHCKKNYRMVIESLKWNLKPA